MKLISARQAWHDAYHESRDSVLAVAAAKAELGKRGRVKDETMPSRSETNGRCAHMLAAGLVQAAIRTLPKPLQQFGHTLYSPLADGQDLVAAHGVVWLGAGLHALSDRQRERAYWMALAAINSHKRAVNGRDPLTPDSVYVFIEERLGVRMDRTHWARDWAAIWERLAKHIDRLDAQALKPVAEVVAKEQRWRKGPGWRWVQVDRGEVAEQRSRQYAEQREAITARLEARLSAMDDAKFESWALRLKAYGAAYRAEWGTEMLEKPDVHRRYHDRAAAFWTRWRVKKQVA